MKLDHALLHTVVSTKKDYPGILSSMSIRTCHLTVWFIGCSYGLDTLSLLWLLLANDLFLTECVQAFSISNIAGAYCDEGQNYKNLIGFMDGLSEQCDSKRLSLCLFVHLSSISVCLSTSRLFMCPEIMYDRKETVLGCPLP